MISQTEIFGDDFNIQQIESWFREEAEAYADLGAKNLSSYKYKYHYLNKLYGYNTISKNNRLNHVLGFGSAYGNELLPILNQVDKITIIDPSDTFIGKNLLSGVTCNWIKPVPCGDLPFVNNTFDLITCFGVLHHIPNVTHVLSEFSRCIKPGGYIMVREPIVSMGDWRNKRVGLTVHERGIPLSGLYKSINTAQLDIIKINIFGFGPFLSLLSKLNINPYNSSILTHVDRFLSKIFKNGYIYHAGTLKERFRPCHAFVLMIKR